MNPMTKTLTRGLAFLSVTCALLLLSACRSSSVEDQLLSRVSLSFDLHPVDSYTARLRGQGDEPSINTDAVDREDYVRRMGLFIFATGVNGAKVLHHFTDESYFTVTFTPGTYDFYLIANYSPADEAYLSTLNKGALESYLMRRHNYTEWQSKSTTYFPMARVYRNQVIPHGGTPYNPIPFRPTTSTSGQLAPISTYGEDEVAGTKQKSANLVRSCAKVSFRLFGKGVESVRSVEYVNPVTQYTLMELPIRTDYAAFPVQGVPLNITWVADGAPLDSSWGTLAGSPTRVAHFYVPERLFDVSENVGWLRDRTLGKDEPIGKVQYLQITLSNARVYKIPIVTNAEQKALGQSYLDFVRKGNGTLKPDFSVVRNMHYHYDIRIEEDVFVGFSVSDYKTVLLDEVVIYPYGMDSE